MLNTGPLLGVYGAERRSMHILVFGEFGDGTAAASYRDIDFITSHNTWVNGNEGRMSMEDYYCNGYCGSEPMSR